MNNLNIIKIPGPYAKEILFRCSVLPRQGDFNKDIWKYEKMSFKNGYYSIDLNSLQLRDGSYEYEFLVDFEDDYLNYLKNKSKLGNHPEIQPNRELAYNFQGNGEKIYTCVSDPYAGEITKFGGYRGVFHIKNGKRIELPFNWDSGVEQGKNLPGNNELVIYELPMRWVDSSPDGLDRQIGLGTIEKAYFKYLDYIEDLGVNAIELLPVFDSSDTLNWGYGTRYFYAPDYDMGEPFDLKLFIKSCHSRGIRVILDVVMNHSKHSPLEILALEHYYLTDNREEPDPDGEPRNDWGGMAFRYSKPFDGKLPARDFHFDCAKYWIEEYHIDGFRIDEFKGINSYDFIQDFTERAHVNSRNVFPEKPFIVIAEDSWRRNNITHEGIHRGKKVVDAMWDFNFRDDVRKLISNTLTTYLGGASRSEVVEELVSVGGGRMFYDMAQRISYVTSHDVEHYFEQRLIPFLNSQMGYIEDSELRESLIYDAAKSGFAIMLTAAGIPMFLAGEEFGDLHDTVHSNWKMKMSDPIDWSRKDEGYHRGLLLGVKELIELRRNHFALKRNEVEFFGLKTKYGRTGFHYSFDENEGERVFAYCRTGGKPIGHPDQVIVISNLNLAYYEHFYVKWPWNDDVRLREYGRIPGQNAPEVNNGIMDIQLSPFQTRVFSTY